MQLRMTKDFLSGLIFLALGAGGAWMATGYNLGTGRRMGPGYFPLLVGIVIALLGAAIVIRALRYPDSSETVAVWDVRPFIFIIAGIVAFMLLIESHGVAVSVAALTIFGAFARPGVKIVETIVLAAVLIALAYGIFVLGLHIPLKMVA